MVSRIGCSRASERSGNARTGRVIECPVTTAERPTRVLEARIDRLPERLRIVFVLRAVEQMTVEETAAALDIPEATVRTRFFRARSQLREALSQEIDLAVDDAFAFAGERCERIVARVMARLAAGEGDLR